MVLGLVFLSCSHLNQGKQFIYEKIDRRQLIAKATQAYQVGNFEEAANYYQRVLNHNQDDVIVSYNLACCYALQGDSKMAANYVRHAYANGFRNLDILHKDPDFDPVRDDPVFKNAVKEIDAGFESIGTLAYVEAPSMLPYRIRYPEGYDAGKSYPLLIGMHGNGGNADGFVSLYDKLENPQIIYVAPEGQYPRSMNIGPEWHARTWTIPGIDRSVWQSADPLVSTYILNTIKKVSAEHKISNVYLMGFSQGAVYAYTIGLQNPDIIEGVIGFSGYLMEVDGKNSVLSSEDIANGKDLRIYIAHGVDDAAISVEAARKLKSYIESQGFDLTYQEFDGRHGVKADIFNDAVEWMQL